MEMDENTPASQVHRQNKPAMITHSISIGAPSLSTPR